MPINAIHTLAQCTEDPYSQLVDDPYYDATYDTIKGLIDKLQNLPASGNINVDFLSQEISLFKGIVSTASTIDGYTKNPEITSFTTDVLDDYSNHLRELRILLNDLLKDKSKIDKANDDKAYMNDYKEIINTLSKDIENTDVNENPEITYIKQTLAFMKAANALALNEATYSKNTLIREIAENILKATDRDIIKLANMAKAFN